MQKVDRTGTCLFCEKSFKKSVLKKHCEHCELNTLNHNPDKGDATFYLLVEGRGMPEYFLYLYVSSKGTLYDLDNFLRSTWLECCGHMSCFHIGGQNYSDRPDDEFDDESMDIRLSKIFQPGVLFTYEYDFGSTTELNLKVLSSGRAVLGKEMITLLARNNEPALSCIQCGKPAVNICSTCVSEGTGSLCSTCAKKHECGEEMILPSVNSPRSGICAYTG